MDQFQPLDDAPRRHHHHSKRHHSHDRKRKDIHSSRRKSREKEAKRHRGRDRERDKKKYRDRRHHDDASSATEKESRSGSCSLDSTKSEAEACARKKARRDKTAFRSSSAFTEMLPLTGATELGTVKGSSSKQKKSSSSSKHHRDSGPSSAFSPFVPYVPTTTTAAITTSTAGTKESRAGHFTVPTVLPTAPFPLPPLPPPVFDDGRAASESDNEADGPRKLDVDIDFNRPLHLTENGVFDVSSDSSDRVEELYEGNFSWGGFSSDSDAASEKGAVTSDSMPMPTGPATRTGDNFLVPSLPTASQKVGHQTEKSFSDLINFAKESAARLRQEATHPKANGLQALNEALLKPVTASSTGLGGELVLVDASDEAHQSDVRAAQRKMAAPPAGETKRLRKLKYVDHSTMSYLPFGKDFYIPPPDVKALSETEVQRLLKDLDGAKVTGHAPPRPMPSWEGIGLAERIVQVLQTKGFVNPFSVQSLAAPVLMSGRDLLLTAKTGSGKTLAYLLPMIRHVGHQRRCDRNEGPIGLVLVPTNELAVQVFNAGHDFCQAAGLRLTLACGMSGLAENIKKVKSGCDLLVATPGRLLDLLTLSSGNVCSLSRTTFVVIDEADRLFDSGFMEHVAAFLKNVRPDRQLAMVSATMPKMLRKVIVGQLKDPIEISVGGRPTPASNVDQQFYFFDQAVYDATALEPKDDGRFAKLLQLLGEECPHDQHLVLVFVDRKEECDLMVARLSAAGYSNRMTTLYAGMDQVDRKFALENFRPGAQYILVATGVAERGLDIPFLELVVNFDMPDHYEAYVHRIGRTGRAGKRGKAASFFVREQDDDIAGELCTGLELAGQQVPEELVERAMIARERRMSLQADHNASFRKGYRRAKKQVFHSRDQREMFRAAAKASGIAEYLSDSDSDNAADSDEELVGKRDDPDILEMTASVVEGGGTESETTGNVVAVYKGGAMAGALVVSAQQEDRIAEALRYAEKVTKAHEQPGETKTRFQSEYPINDFPDMVRSKLQSAALLKEIQEETGTTIVKKGVYVDARARRTHKLKEGERPLYLLIIGQDQLSVRSVFRRLDAIRDEAKARQLQKISAIGAVL